MATRVILDTYQWFISHSDFFMVILVLMSVYLHIDIYTYRCIHLREKNYPEILDEANLKPF